MASRESAFFVIEFAVHVYILADSVPVLSPLS
jgi:hypothetical protein